MSQTESAPAGLLRGVDRAAFVAAFGDRLRRSGVDVSLGAIERAAAALDVSGPLAGSDLYWLLRVSLVREPRQLAAFDAVFAAIFDDARGATPEWRGTRHQDAADDLLLGLRRSVDNAPATTGGVPWTTLPSVTDTEASPGDAPDLDDDAAIPELQPSLSAAELDRPFDLLDEEELLRVSRLLDSALDQWPERRSRRRRLRRAHGGPVALRRSLRDALDTGGEVIRLTRSRPRQRPRKLLVVLDVSGSMEPYARAYLHLIRPLAVARRAEVFAVATELSRITSAVRLRSAEHAMDRVTEVVGDRFSGTRLASSLRALLNHRVWSTAVRGAVVVVFSDGWDADDPAALDRVMRRLRRLAHRVVWVNPRAGFEGFAPVTGGMAAAHPHCDHFLAGHTARSMQSVVAAIVGGRMGA